MDSFEEQELLYKKLFALVKEMPEIPNPHKVRIRIINYLYDMNLDIEVDGKLSVTKRHEIAKALEDKIKATITNVYDVVIHVEPVGNVEDEQFGLSSNDFQKSICVK